jgi:ABC-type ATPase involved in cell division
MYFLPDDRNVRITTEAEPEYDEDDDLVPSDDGEFKTVRHVTTRLPERRESHHLELGSVLTKLSSWFRSHAFLGSSAGEENATNIYLNVVENLARWAADSPGEGQAQLIRRLERLEARIERFTRFGLITPFPAKKFIELFNLAQPATRHTIGTIIEPYINGLEARLNALDLVRDLIRTYVETINEFLAGKSIDFSLPSGVFVAARHGKLDPDLLSSGEKQLILLLSNTVLARESAAIFLIDEPELSLNIKWQRSLVEALLKCSEGSKVQFLLASHSLELITQQRRNAIQLISAIDARH